MFQINNYIYLKNQQFFEGVCLAA